MVVCCVFPNTRGVWTEKNKYSFPYLSLVVGPEVKMEWTAALVGNLATPFAVYEEGLLKFWMRKFLV